MYALPESPTMASASTNVWLVPADGSGAPRLLLGGATRQRSFDYKITWLWGTEATRRPHCPPVEHPLSLPCSSYRACL
jgi:hypothetical protein